MLLLLSPMMQIISQLLRTLVTRLHITLYFHYHSARFFFLLHHIAHQFFVCDILLLNSTTTITHLLKKSTSPECRLGLANTIPDKEAKDHAQLFQIYYGQRSISALVFKDLGLVIEIPFGVGLEDIFCSSSSSFMNYSWLSGSLSKYYLMLQISPPSQ